MKLDLQKGFNALVEGYKEGLDFIEDIEFEKDFFKI